MALRTSVFIVLLCSFLMGFGIAAQPEFRGIWVHNWIPGLLNPKQVDETFEWAKDTNMNAILVQVRRVGDAYYDSKYEPAAANLQTEEDFDLLAYSIKKAREHNMEIHAWINIYRVWTTDSKPPNPKHIANVQPEWMSKTDDGEMVSGDGQFLDPGVPEVREFIVNIILDILEKYDVDGIHLDYIRYPGRNWGYNDISLARFNEKYGRSGRPQPTDAQWSQWRRDQVTETVREIYKKVTEAKPYVKVTASTIVWGSCPDDFTRSSAYSSVFQDWKLWMQEGILDANMPMNYKNPGVQRHQQWYSGWVDGMKKWAYNRHVYNGIMVFQNNAAGAVSQAKIARDKGVGFAGFAFSQGNHSEPIRKQLMTLFDKPAPLPEMPWKPARESSGESNNSEGN